VDPRAISGECERCGWPWTAPCATVCDDHRRQTHVVSWLPETIVWRNRVRESAIVWIFGRPRQHGCSISTWFTTPNVITYLSLPLPPSQR
jgi:hypothetical protein